MNLNAIDLKKLLVLLFVVALPLMSINIGHKNQEDYPALLRPFSLITGFIQNAYAGLSSGVRGTTSQYLNLVNIRVENRSLVKANSELRAQLGALTELKLENERLNKLLQFKHQSNMELLAAKVIGNDLLPDHSTITINRGTKHGLKKNMAAITTGGAVGYVIRVEPHTARILLLTDRYAAIDTIVQRTRIRGVTEGLNRTTCKLSHLQRSDDVKPGDLLVTSGLNKIFPKGFPVGTVTTVQKTPYGMSQDVELNPSINPFNLEEIFVVLNAKGEDFTPKEDEPNKNGELLETEEDVSPQEET